LHTTDSRNSVGKALEEVQKRFPDGIALLDPIENMGIRDDSFKKLLRVSTRDPLICQLIALTKEQKIEVLESHLLANPLHNSPRLAELYNQYAEKVQLVSNIKATKRKISEAMSIMQLDELKCRKRVLRRFGFINEVEVVQLKARVACVISTGDELMLSELLFNGFFNKLTPEQCAAALSVFVFEEKAKDTPSLSKEELYKPLKEIQAQARIIAKVSQESKLSVNEEEYVQSFHWELMEVIYEWAHGKSFAEIW
jgi:ATP-dependent RNA helicase DOB1